MFASRPPVLRWSLGVTLFAASAGAWALGLGEIRVLSPPGSPLVAEIPVISSDPSELEQLRAGLASPVVFERVGLERPHGLVSELDFAVAVAGDGRPVIRVTSRSPVQQTTVNFLVEVDWGQGRLVREYSALVNAPGVMAAEGQPVLKAPMPVPSDAIVRAPETPGVASTAQAPAEAMVPAPQPTHAKTSPTATSVVSGEVRVGYGQTLSQIAQRLNLDGNLDQKMVALLRANPDAFIHDNLNLLRQGAVLRMPVEGAEALPSAEAAASLVQQHIAAWRKRRELVPQPVVPEPAVTGMAVQAKAPRGARLEIAPAATGGDTRQAVGNSGRQAGGKGDMATSEALRQTREDLAARESELQELRERVADLEKLQKDQAALIVLKETALAQSQQQLAERQAENSSVVWWLGGLLLLLAGLIAGYCLRRKPAPVVRMETAVPSFAHKAQLGPKLSGDEAQIKVLQPAVIDAVSAAGSVPVSVSAPNAQPAPGLHREAPAAIPSTSIQSSTHVPKMVPGSSLGEAPPLLAPSEWTAASSSRPTWHAGVGNMLSASLRFPADSMDEEKRLDLALACLELGDEKTARALLIQVAQGEDAAAREEAAQLLRGLA